MPSKAQANAAPPVRHDLPWALATLANADMDSGHLLQALNFLLALDLSQHQQDLEVAVQLVTTVAHLTAASDSQVNSSATKMLTRLVAEGRGALQEALRQPACLQAVWSVICDFHAVFDDYVACLAALAAEAADPVAALAARGTGGGGGKAEGGRPVKGTPPPPVDPESTLPGPTKYALEAVLAALSCAVGSGPAGEEAAAAVVGRGVGPLLTLLRHNSSRIQVLTLRCMRLLLRSGSLAAALAGGGCLTALTQLVGGSGFGAVREEAMLTASHVMAAHAPSLQLALDAGLPTSLLHLLLSPATGLAAPPPQQQQQQPAAQTPPVPQALPSEGGQPSEGQLRPGSSSEDAAGWASNMAGGGGPEAAAAAGGTATPGAPAGAGAPAEAGQPAQLEFGRPVLSSPERLQDLSAQLLLQLAQHHHGACLHLLRLGALQLLLTQLPAPAAHNTLYNQLHNPHYQPPQRHSHHGHPHGHGNSPQHNAALKNSASMKFGRVPSTGDLQGAGRKSPQQKGAVKAAGKGKQVAAEDEDEDDEEEEGGEAVEEDPDAAETTEEQEAREAWQPFLEGAPALPLPPSRTPSPSPNLQATLLLLLSCLLAEPGVQQHCWATGAAQAPLHLVPLFHLALQPPPPPPPPRSENSQRENISPARRSTIAPPPPPPDPTQPPFAPHVRAAALQCLLQLTKQRRWLAAAPFLAALQETLRAPDSWGPEMVSPLAEILQRIAQSRRPRPKAAAAAAAPAPRRRPRFPAPPPATTAPAAPAAAPTSPGPPGAFPPPGASLSGGASLSSLSVGSAPGDGPGGSPTAGMADEADELRDSEVLAALKALALLARQGPSPWAPASVAAALLTLPQSALFAPPWPPLPSPPPTPPPPPLPTSQYLWDALGRPVMTDGIKLVHL